MVPRESEVHHSRPRSSRQDNVRAPPLKKTVKIAPNSLHKNIDNPRPSSLSLDNGKAPMPRTTRVPRPSFSRPQNDMVSRPKDDEKSKPSRLRDESYSSKLERLSFRGSKDDSNSTFQILKKNHISSVVHNSSNAKQMSISHLQKEDQIIQNHRPNSDDKSKGKMTKLLSEDKLCMPMKRTKPHDDSESKEFRNCKPVKRRMFICTEDGDEDDSDQNLLGGDVGTDALTTPTVVMKKDHRTEVSNPLVYESFNVQEHSDLPIDEPIWRGDIKLGNKEYGSLAAHLSAKHCDKVWKISKSLRPVVEVTKLSTLEAWPKSLEASRPTDDNIALYFLPHEMRQNVDLNQLVKEVMENDVVLQAIVEEAEMLIFPSILLPERHQTFKGKPYLWAVFKRRKDKVATPTLDEERRVGCCARAEDKHASPREGHRVAGLSTCVESQEVERQVTEQEQTPSFARPKASRPAEGTNCSTQTPTIRAAMQANYGQIPSCFGVSQSVSTAPLFGFIAGQTP